MTLPPGPREPLALDESGLMAEVGAGSVAAFGALYDRYCNRAYRVAFSVCRDDGRAQDAVQEAFGSIWKSRSTYRQQRGTAAAWVLSAVRHRAIDLERQDASEEQLQQFSAAEAADDAREQAIEHDNAERLHAALALLPDAQQEVITLAFYGQLNHTEIAAQLGLPPGTVKGRMATLAAEHENQ